MSQNAYCDPDQSVAGSDESETTMVAAALGAANHSHHGNQHRR